MKENSFKELQNNIKDLEQKVSNLEHEVNELKYRQENFVILTPNVICDSNNVDIDNTVDRITKSFQKKMNVINSEIGNKQELAFLIAANQVQKNANSCF